MRQPIAFLFLALATSAHAEALRGHGTGLITTGKIASDAITSPKIADDAVATAKIAAGAVTTPKVSVDAITAVKILNFAVTTDKISPGAVSTGKILVDAVTSVAILDASITTVKLNTDLRSLIGSPSVADGSITTDKLSAGAVTAPKILDGTITTAKIAHVNVSTHTNIDENTTSISQTSMMAAVAQSTITLVTTEHGRHELCVNANMRISDSAAGASCTFLQNGAYIDRFTSVIGTWSGHGVVAAANTMWSGCYRTKTAYPAGTYNYSIACMATAGNVQFCSNTSTNFDTKCTFEASTWK